MSESEVIEFLGVPDQHDIYGVTTNIDIPRSVLHNAEAIEYRSFLSRAFDGLIGLSYVRYCLVIEFEDDGSRVTRILFVS